MDIQRNGSKPSGKGPAEFFTGSVRIDPLIQTTAPARVGGAIVTFEPGARSAWHTHPLGQMLIVTAGCGLVQSWGGPVVKIRPGDVVWCPPGEKHWHGAPLSATTSSISLFTRRTKSVQVVATLGKSESCGAGAAGCIRDV